MKKSGASQSQPASDLISKRIAELKDWRGKTLGRMRTLIKEAEIETCFKLFLTFTLAPLMVEIEGRKFLSDRRAFFFKGTP